MKTVFSNSQLAHVWAQQKQDFGKGSNMFFETTKIYSYGRHFCIANFIKPNVVLFNNATYSNSTSKHQTYVHRALHGVSAFAVPFVNPGDAEHIKNTEHFKTQVLSCIEKANTATKSSGWLLSQAQMYNSQGLGYCKEFELIEIAWFEKPFEISDKLKARIEHQSEKVRIESEQREIKQAEKRKAIIDFALPAWLNNENQFEYNNEQHSTNCVSELNESYLRLRGDCVYTSHGANVPLKPAKILFDLIKSGRDIKGFEIGNYTVIGINGVLTVGCHKIKRSEINRFASLMGWGQIEETH